MGAPSERRESTGAGGISTLADTWGGTGRYGRPIGADGALAGRGGSAGASAVRG
ncbi:hypothetical protein AB0945_21700 [Streptomyces sp. NPDC005474]|uniref:hypothetical protein n=1 Tax=Streptomyces sp. NPDC005474 TaxID=3154878 RepID=UPI003455F072